jgi:hypothetical protein
MLDPNGVNPKNRRAVIVTSDDDLATGQPIVVVAIAGYQRGQSLTDDCVRLPWQAPHGHPVTRINKPSAAVCTWIEEISEDRILEVKGRVVGPFLGQIAAQLARIRNQGESEE